jgi:Family of unknown function (DUF6644)
VVGLRDVLAWIESSALGTFMRQTGPWTYGLVNLVHILGVATLFGSILILDLHLIGLWRRAPLAALSRTIVPVGKVGFVVAAASGACLLSSNATEYVGNPFFLIKFPAIALGLLNVWLIGRTAGWRARGEREPSPAEGRQLAVLGAISLASWLTAISAGRMIGYW